MRKFVSQYYIKSYGGVLDPYYEKFLVEMVKVAANREGQTRASRANKTLGLGFRNLRPINPDDDSPEREVVTISMTLEAKQDRLRESL
jgi:hypothetical protein